VQVEYGDVVRRIESIAAAESIADEIWKLVVDWQPFVRDTMGNQSARAADSIGANIAESFGRFHYGDKLQFLYYARGSLFETKYWLNRAQARKLMSPDVATDLSARLTSLARQLNIFAGSLKAQRLDNPAASKTKRLQETSAKYMAETADRMDDLGISELLFSEIELQLLLSDASTAI
jgi:four helix bundle protein